MLLHVMAVLSGSTAVVMVFALLLIIQPRPWWSAQYLIAILGLLLGTALSCVATGLSSAIDELSRGGWLAWLTSPTLCSLLPFLRPEEPCKPMLLHSNLRPMHPACASPTQPRMCAVSQSVGIPLT